MALNPKQRAAIFEKLKTSPKLNQNIKPLPQPKAPMPVSPTATPKAPSMKQMYNFNDIPQQTTMKNQVNPNFVGNGKAQRFMKLKKLSGF